MRYTRQTKSVSRPHKIHCGVKLGQSNTYYNPTKPMQAGIVKPIKLYPQPAQKRMRRSHVSTKSRLGRRKTLKKKRGYSSRNPCERAEYPAGELNSLASSPYTRQNLEAPERATTPRLQGHFLTRVTLLTSQTITVTKHLRGW